MKKQKLAAILIIAGLAAVFLFLFYGPFEGFRLLWINTAMYSSRHQFLATALYPRSYIEKVLALPLPQEQTDLQPPPENDSSAVSFTELKGEYFRGYMLKIDDPRRLTLVGSAHSEGQYLEDMVESVQGLGGVNGGGFEDHEMRGLPWGMLIVNGELAFPCTKHRLHSIGGMTSSHKLVVGRMDGKEITEKDFLWAFEFGPILLINGEKTVLNQYTGGIAPRTAIGQTREGQILLVVIDGRQSSSLGAYLHDVQTIMYENGAVNAISLDGGASSCMVYRGELVNSPSEGKRGRLIPNAVVFR
jgi:exopolysaccharide biosynthesis protein